LDRIPELLGEIERLRAVLWAGLTIRRNRPQPPTDHLLGIEQAAARPGTSKDWLRHSQGRSPCIGGRDDLLFGPIVNQFVSFSKSL
jgi:hypothetical protein